MPQEPMNRFKFFLEGLAHLQTRASVTPTSRYTSRMMLDNIDFQSARTVLELGPGDGKLTRDLLDRMHPDARLYCFEISKTFCEELNTIRDERLSVFHRDAIELDLFLQESNLQGTDHIVSSIPFVMIPRKKGDTILQKSKNALRPGGKFVQFHYSLLAKKRYHQIFDEVDISFEWRNFPPAFVFVCR